MSISITTYKNTSDNNTLNKTLETIGSNITAVLKDDTDILQPTLILSGNVSQSFNYVYISTFNRYYFVTSRTYAQQRYYIQLQIDVLMTYNTAISNLTVIANRSSSRFNLYQTDGEISFLNKNDVITYPFPNGFNGYSLILAVNGGGHNNP